MKMRNYFEEAVKAVGISVLGYVVIRVFLLVTLLLA